jgi:hypothetical protein
MVMVHMQEEPDPQQQMPPAPGLLNLIHLKMKSFLRLCACKKLYACVCHLHKVLTMIQLPGH